MHGAAGSLWGLSYENSYEKGPHIINTSVYFIVSCRPIRQPKAETIATPQMHHALMRNTCIVYAAHFVRDKMDGCKHKPTTSCGVVRREVGIAFDVSGRSLLVVLPRLPSPCLNVEELCGQKRRWVVVWSCIIRGGNSKRGSFRGTNVFKHTTARSAKWQAKHTKQKIPTDF